MLLIKICFPVYKIPPLSANEGHRANNWGDLACPLWKGRLRVIENSKGAALHLEDAQTGELECLLYLQSLIRNSRRM